MFTHKASSFKHRHRGAGASFCTASAFPITYPERDLSFLKIKSSHAGKKESWTRSDVTLIQISFKKVNVHLSNTN